MNRESCDRLIQHLRDELTAYGDLLAHFERQQRELFKPEPEAVLEFARSMESCVRETETARAAREACVRELACAEGLDPDTTLRQLVPFAPEVLRPMLESFVGEISRLIHGIRRRSRQNHQMLSRMYQLHRDALQELGQVQKPTTYGAAGKIRSSAGSAFSVAG